MNAFFLYVIIVGCFIIKYYDEMKMSSQRYLQEKKKVSPKYNKQYVITDDNNPYVVKIITEVPLEIEQITGIPTFGQVGVYEETINYLDKPFEEWPEELLDKYIKNEEEYDSRNI